MASQPIEFSLLAVFHSETLGIQASFLAAFILTLLFFIGVLVLFYRRRNLQPIKSRPVRTIVASWVFVGLFSFETSLRHIWLDEFPCWTRSVFLAPLLWAGNCYLLRVWLLWFEYKSTVQKSALQKPFVKLSPKDNEIIKRANWYLKHKHYASDSFLFKMFLAKSAVDTSILIVGYIIDPAPLFGKQTLLNFGCSDLRRSSLWITLAIWFVDALIFGWAATKYGPVNDGFYRKRELKLSGTYAAVGIPLWIGLLVAQNYVSFPFAWLITSFNVAVIMMISGVYPLWKSYKMKQKRHTHSVVGSSVPEYRNFNAVLASTTRREEFRKHLELEFSVENLMFWEAVEEYKQQFDGKTPSLNRNRAEALARRFIESGSVAQINLDHTTKKTLEEALHDENITESMFNVAQCKIERLMACDPFVRFEQKREHTRTQTWTQTAEHELLDVSRAAQISKANSRHETQSSIMGSRSDIAEAV